MPDSRRVVVLAADPHASGAQAAVRAVDADGVPLSPAGRRLEVEAGSDWAQRGSAGGPMPVGSARILDGGRLGVEFVIQVALRASDDAGGERSVREALRNALRRAVEWEIHEIALPLLGTGPGGLDVEAACRAMQGPLREFLDGDPDRRVLVCAGDPFERETALRSWAAEE